MEKLLLIGFDKVSNGPVATKTTDRSHNTDKQHKPNRMTHARTSSGIGHLI
nr:hypothetical protein [Pontibacter pudoricolor]